MRARARLYGWDEAQRENRSDSPDPAVPTLEGLPEWVEGELVVHHVRSPLAGFEYDKYMVKTPDGIFDVDPDTVTELIVDPRGMDGPRR